jgi:mRNA interferase MazF
LEFRRGDIVYIKLDKGVGSEQGGSRPAVIVQNDVGNVFSPTIIVALVTSKTDKPTIPTHVFVPKEYGFDEDSVILCEQLKTVDKRRVFRKYKSLDSKIVGYINQALKISLAV